MHSSYKTQGGGGAPRCTKQKCVEKKILKKDEWDEWSIFGILFVDDPLWEGD